MKQNTTAKVMSPRVANKEVLEVNADVDPFEGFYDDAYAQEFSYSIDGVMYSNDHKEMY